MKISGFHTGRVDGRVRVSATTTWEDSQREETEVFFETDDAQGLSCNPHAFLIACVAPALFYGERRVYLDAELCPALKEGLTTAASMLHYWYYQDKRAPLQIEARALMRRLPAPCAERAGMFFSGGVDAYATLRLNRQHFALDHPYSIKDGILVYGLEQDDPAKFAHVLEVLQRGAAVAGISLIPIYTNIYLPYRDEDARRHFRFWEFEYEGSAFASIAHTLVHRLSAVSISATMFHGTLSFMGSHPLLDPALSTNDMKINHTGILFSRLQKTELIAGWDAILPYLRVCNRYATYRQGSLNCGECEKCIRTKLAFMALATPRALEAFSNRDVTAELIDRRVRVTTPYRESCYKELVPPLTQRGHGDLARAIERKIATYRRWRPTGTPERFRQLCRRAIRKLATLS